MMSDNAVAPAAAPTAPLEIEAASFAIIRRELKTLPEPAASHVPQAGTLEEAVLVRAIHASADFDYAANLICTEGACARGVAALLAGCAVCCDTTMVRAGVNKRALGGLGCVSHAFVADEDVAREATERGVTRSVVAMERACAMPGPKIVAVGNAPTALLRLAELIEAGMDAPALTIAVPVGFVNVVEAKERILSLGVSAIVARGRKGGSTVAAAILNALIYAATRGERT